MTKRIFRSILLTVSLALVICLAVVMGVLYEYFTHVQTTRLRTQTALIAQGVSNEGAAYFDGLKVDDCRITWVDADGTVLYDDTADASTADNHGSREEIWEAMEVGAGESVRYSTTLSQRTLYYAKRLSDGTVLRTSVTQHSILRIVSGMVMPFLLIFISIAALSAWLAKRMARRIVEPLNALNLDSALENEAYEELSPLLVRIERQHRQIERQMDELQRKQDEFSAVTGSMNEGLVLLNDKGEIISINHAAMGIFHAAQDCLGRHMLTIDRSCAMQELVNRALSGSHSEVILDRDGRTYQFVASPVLSDDQAAGAALLAFDVTERAFAEQQRREFSANVSHELKTPLQSIMGSAELMENGLVKQADMPRFIGHIRTEAQRLVTLIDDIIRLSQLDEHSDLPKERVELYALANEVRQSLAAGAEARSVSLSVTGNEVAIQGVRRLLYEILYNLADNAIKYNAAGGHVTLAVTREARHAVLSVSDDGIGIPAEHQARVFERFYRVDKSHSKDTGGTGLGLSIVKHAAQYHNATVSLQSEAGAGTTICIRFPMEITG